MKTSADNMRPRMTKEEKLEESIRSRWSKKIRSLLLEDGVDSRECAQKIVDHAFIIKTKYINDTR